MDHRTKVGEVWNKVSLSPMAPRSRWWTHPAVVKHINRTVCGEPIGGLHAGFHKLLVEKLPNGKAKKAISVGCGSGQKEIALVREGIVQEFHLYEISSVRIEAGKNSVRELGLTDRVFFHEEDAFLSCKDTNFDLVYWNNALHHMMDTEDAIRWSYYRLKSRGLFAMDDFIGPSRFQWTTKMLRLSNLVRGWLPEEYFVHPTDASRKFPRAVIRPTVESMIAADPSEAADSSNILPSIARIFPSIEIIQTGGAIYHTGLNDVLANLSEERDAEFLFSAMAIDKALGDIGEGQYAVAFARKPTYLFRGMKRMKNEVGKLFSRLRL